MTIKLNKEPTVMELKKSLETARIRANMAVIDHRRTQAITYRLAQHIAPDAPEEVKQLAEGVIARVEADQRDVEQLTRIANLMKDAGWW